MGCRGSPPPHKEHAKEPGIKLERSCQDCFFLILFIAFWVGMVVVAIVAGQVGQVQRLEYGTDYLGNLCGVNNLRNSKIPSNYSRDFTSQPYLYYLLVPPFNQYYKLCVSQCPTQTYLLPTADNQLLCTYNESQSLSNLYPLGTCYGTYSSSPILNRCFPALDQNTTTNIANIIASEINSGRSDASVNALMDVAKAWKYILISGAIALGLGFVWVFLLRFVAGILVWLTVAGVMLVLAGTAILASNQADSLQTAYNNQAPEDRLQTQQTNITALHVISYVLGALSVIMFLVVLFMIRRIQIAIGIIKETSKAVVTMPSLFFFPIFIFILLLGLGAYWLGITALLITAGTPTYDNGVYVGYTADTTLRKMQIYHVFGGFWTLNFILALGQCTIAGAVASWYWVHDKKDAPLFPVLTALKRTIRYHLGSLALGSLILAIVQFIKFVLEYIEQKFKKSRAKLALFVVKCLLCCLGYFERFIKFMNKNAYIMIAVYGYSFCHAARRGFELIGTNILRVAALNFVSKFVLFLGKIFVTVLTCLISFVLLKANTTVSFYVIPIIIIGILAFAISSAFMTVYEMAIDTVLLCFCEDCDRNDGSAEKPYFATSSLRQYMDSHKSACSCFGCCVSEHDIEMEKKHKEEMEQKKAGKVDGAT